MNVLGVGPRSQYVFARVLDAIVDEQLLLLEGYEPLSTGLILLIDLLLPAHQVLLQPL